MIATNSGVSRPGSTVFHVSIELKEEGVVKVLFSFLKCFFSDSCLQQLVDNLDCW